MSETAAERNARLRAEADERKEEAKQRLAELTASMDAKNKSR